MNVVKNLNSSIHSNIISFFEAFVTNHCKVYVNVRADYRWIGVCMSWKKFRNNEEVRNKICTLDKNHFVFRNQPA